MLMWVLLFFLLSCYISEPFIYRSIFSPRMRTLRCDKSWMPRLPFWICSKKNVLGTLRTLKEKNIRFAGYFRYSFSICSPILLSITITCIKIITANNKIFPTTFPPQVGKTARIASRRGKLVYFRGGTSNGEAINSRTSGMVKFSNWIKHEYWGEKTLSILSQLANISPLRNCIYESTTVFFGNKRE